MVPTACKIPAADGASAAETRIAIDGLHARGYLTIAADGTVIARMPVMPD